MDFTEEQIERYSRHIILPEVGGEGQKKIMGSSVFCVGAGGLGSPITYYLAAAGVGRIGVIDPDFVEASNLQRQIVHTTADIGRPKAHSCKETLQSLNPDITVDAYHDRLTIENVMDLIADYDIVLDGCDNFPTRFLVNDACFFAEKPLISGSVFRFEGQVSDFIPHDGGPCYRCLYEEPPPPGLVPSCQEAGILGAVVGTIGVIQAIEALKYILKIGDLLTGRLMVFNAYDMSFRELKIGKRPDCPLCGEDPTITELIQYDDEGCVIRET